MSYVSIYFFFFSKYLYVMHDLMVKRNEINRKTSSVATEAVMEVHCPLKFSVVMGGTVVLQSTVISTVLSLFI